jgi:hypothetical protein
MLSLAQAGSITTNLRNNEYLWIGPFTHPALLVDVSAVTTRQQPPRHRSHMLAK